MITGLTTSVGLALYYRMDGSLIPTIGSAVSCCPAGVAFGQYLFAQVFG